MSKSVNTHKDWSVKDLSDEEQKNLLGFFALLIKVDKRLNPNLYKNYEDNRSEGNAPQSA